MFGFNRNKKTKSVIHKVGAKVYETLGLTPERAEEIIDLVTILIGNKHNNMDNGEVLDYVSKLINISKSGEELLYVVYVAERKIGTLATYHSSENDERSSLRYYTDLYNSLGLVSSGKNSTVIDKSPKRNAKDDFGFLLDENGKPDE